MNKDCWNAFIIGDNETHYIIVSEHNRKKFYTLEKTVDTMKPVELDGTVVVIHENHLNNASKMLSAVKGYIYDYDRRTEAQRKKREIEKKEKEENLKKLEAQGLMKTGRYKNVIYKDIVERDKPYCDYVLKKKELSEEMQKFKDWLLINYKKDEPVQPQRSKLKSKPKPAVKPE